jgi:NAD-dependent dihydropyrimidine dehydrogenase PreA subunit
VAEDDAPPHVFGSDRHAAILGGERHSNSGSNGHPDPRRNQPVTYVIAQPCVDLKDRACIEECPVDCIYEGERSLYIHPDECVDCGACEPVCPVEAIYYEDDVPEQWKDYYKANVEFFDDLGSPGGAAKLGIIPKDHPIITALPPQEHDE